jgi:7-cyano-7-deazaguanine synthase in queuosine biosynthesis
MKKLRILRNYGDLKKDQIIESEGNQRQFLLENAIACVAPDESGCDGDCDECEDCKGKTKKSPAKSAPKKTTTKKTTTKKSPAKK